MRIHTKLIWGASLIKSVATEAGGLYLLLNNQYPIWGSALVVIGGVWVGISVANIICGEDKYFNIKCLCKEERAKEREQEQKQEQIAIVSPATSIASNLLDTNYDKEIFKGGLQLVAATSLKSPSNQSQYESIQ